jgi:DNA-binding CsgD family transcriptional regulator
MFKVLQEAKKRWGAKAVAAIKYFLEGKTEQEAAELAGITDRTFRNYQTRLRKILSSKK